MSDENIEVFGFTKDGKEFVMISLYGIELSGDVPFATNLRDELDRFLKQISTSDPETSLSTGQAGVS